MVDPERILANALDDEYSSLYLADDMMSSLEVSSDGQEDENNGKDSTPTKYFTGLLFMIMKFFLVQPSTFSKTRVA